MAEKNIERSREVSEPPPPSPDEGHDGPRQFITPLISIETQVGVHVIRALQQTNTVAVLTTVAPGHAGQSIVSVGLDAERLEQVQEILTNSPIEELPRVPCVGFQCFLPPKDEASS